MCFTALLPGAINYQQHSAPTREAHSQPAHPAGTAGVPPPGPEPSVPQPRPRRSAARPPRSSAGSNEARPQQTHGDLSSSPAPSARPRSPRSPRPPGPGALTGGTVRTAGSSSAARRPRAAPPRLSQAGPARRPRTAAAAAAAAASGRRRHLPVRGPPPPPRGGAGREGPRVPALCSGRPRAAPANLRLSPRATARPRPIRSAVLGPSPPRASRRAGRASGPGPQPLPAAPPAKPSPAPSPPSTRSGGRRLALPSLWQPRGAAGRRHGNRGAFPPPPHGRASRASRPAPRPGPVVPHAAPGLLDPPGGPRCWAERPAGSPSLHERARRLLTGLLWAGSRALPPRAPRHIQIPVHIWNPIHGCPISAVPEAEQTTQSHGRGWGWMVC